MLDGRDVRLWPLGDRREALQELINALPVTIRYSETFNVSLAQLTSAVRQNHLEGIVAKAGRQPLPVGRAFPRLAEVACESWARVRHWWQPAEW
jgi:ATP-dependent DNA ligase